MALFASIGWIPAVLLVPVIGLAASALPHSSVATQEANDDARLNAFLDAAYDARNAANPARSAGGIETQLDDFTGATEQRQLDLMQSQLAEMRERFDPSRLSFQGRISYTLAERAAQNAEEHLRWRDYRTVIHRGGPPVEIASALVNSRVTTLPEAEAYISRLEDVERALLEVSADLRARAAKNIVDPAFLFQPAIKGASAIITGAPFDNGPDSPIWADFKRKIVDLPASSSEKDRLLRQAEAALLRPVRRGYSQILKTLRELEPLASPHDGVWRLPGGDEYYASRLRSTTSSEFTADQIHAMGLREMERIHSEMKALKDRIGFKGSLHDFFYHIKTDPEFSYPDTAEGGAAYLGDVQATVDAAMEASAQYFERLPDAPLEVKAVESWREHLAPLAFYSPAEREGDRAAAIYVNLADVSESLKPLVQAIACHEGAPGHHFEDSYTREQMDLPKFRRLGAGYMAFGEGWGLYAEQLCAEMKVYDDLYSQFGYLAMDAWRVARLVVDTGLHAKHWTRAQARDYMLANTLISKLDAVREVDRYVAIPAQAASYKVGHLKILDLRERSKQALGSNFDIRRFHHALLAGGGVPLDILEQEVDSYIALSRNGDK